MKISKKTLTDIIEQRIDEQKSLVELFEENDYGFTVRTFYNHLEKNKEIKTYYYETKKIFDFEHKSRGLRTARAALLKLIKKGNIAAIKFFLEKYDDSINPNLIEHEQLIMASIIKKFETSSFDYEILSKIISVLND